MGSQKPFSSGFLCSARFVLSVGVAHTDVPGTSVVDTNIFMNIAGNVHTSAPRTQSVAYFVRRARFYLVS